MRRGRLLAGLMGAAAVLVPTAPAAADPARPGDYSSSVTAVEPRVAGIDVEVTGGDAFLRLTVDRGVAVVVEGYEGEPYLRVLADGGVERNRRSPATYLNDDRYGEVDVPPDAGADAEPAWERVAGGGTWAWHDHRAHWMAPDAPPAVPRGGTFPWNGPVPLTVDGTPVLVQGEITFHQDVSPLPWLAVAALLGVGLAVVGPRLPRPVAAGLLAVVAVAAVLVAWVPFSSAAPGAEVAPTQLALAAIAVVLAVAALALRRAAASLTLVLAAVAALGGWAAARLDVLANPVLPTSLPADVDRAVTAAAVGVAVGVAVAVLRRRTTPAATAGGAR